MTNALPDIASFDALSIPEHQTAFLEELQKQNGNLSATCRAFGLVRRTVNYRRLRDPAFGQAVTAVRTQVRRMRAEGLSERAKDHLEAHLEQSWTWKRDPETGDLEVDENLDPIKISTIHPKGVVDIHKELRQELDGPDEAVHVTTNFVNTGGATSRFTMGVRPDVDSAMAAFQKETIDAEIEEITEADWDR